MRGAIASGLTAAIAASAASAQAFTYPEHHILSRAAFEHAAAVEGEATQTALKSLQGYIQSGAASAAWPVDIDLAGAAAPGDRFHVADLPALAADHAPDPLSLLTRWFWWVDSRHTCSFQNFLDGLGGLDNSAHEPNECLDGGSDSRRFAVDRTGFIATVRAYHDAHGILKSTGDIDVPIARHDCAYTCLAERGRTHFRIPTLTIEDASNRSDYPNSAAAYAANHAIALGLAMRSTESPERAPYLGLALVFEAFALHYLQDGVAPGHITSVHYGYGNISVNATHDYYNWKGIPVALPRALCVEVQRAEHRARFPRLVSQCEKEIEQRTAVVRGDHAIADKLTDRTDEDRREDITSELATFLSASSLLEVVRAPRKPDWLAYVAQREATARFEDFIDGRRRCFHIG